MAEKGRAGRQSVPERSQPCAYAQFDRVLAVADRVASLGAGELVDVALKAVLSSSSGRSEVKQALAALGFIDDRGLPTTLFRRFAREPDSRSEILARILGERFENALTALTGGADRTRLAELIHCPGKSAQTDSRAVSFFLAAAEMTGIDVSYARRSRNTRADRSQHPLVAESLGPSIPSYEQTLRRAMNQLLTDAAISDPATFERFERLGDRYERWVRDRQASETVALTELA